MSYVITLPSLETELKPLKSYPEETIKKLKESPLEDRLVAVVTIEGDSGQQKISEEVIKELVDMGLSEKSDYKADKVKGVDCILNYHKKRVATTEYYVLVKKKDKEK